MSSETKTRRGESDVLESVLGEVPRNREFLVEYVRELELNRHEEDTFRRLAFRDVNPGGALSMRGDSFVVSVFSEMYEPLSPEEKVAVRTRWHEQVRKEANERFSDLRDRLSNLA